MHLFLDCMNNLSSLQTFCVCGSFRVFIPPTFHTLIKCNVLNYVHIEDNKFERRDSFLGFFPVSRKTAPERT
jgi:hypothetical protein